MLMEKTARWAWRLISRIAGAFFRLVYGLAGRELTDERLGALLQFVKFCLVGLSNTAISFLVYYIFVFIDKRLYLIGSVLGFAASVLNAYYWNKKYVFKKKGEPVRVLIKTFAAYGTNLLIGTGVLYLLVDAAGLSAYIAPFINLIITVPLNFLLNKFWVMKDRDEANNNNRYLTKR